MDASNFLPYSLEVCVSFDMFINIHGFDDKVWTYSYTLIAREHLRQYYHQLVIKWRRKKQNNIKMQKQKKQQDISQRRYANNAISARHIQTVYHNINI